MNKHLIERAFDGFKKVNALVIGDVMIDAYYRGTTDRISPEAPVPVVSVTHRESRPGGAANVAKNIASMGGTAYLCSFIGHDETGKQFTRLLEEDHLSTAGILTLENRTTTSKTRIISRQQQLLRVDEEITEPVKLPETKQLLAVVYDLIKTKNIDLVIFEDYDKGLITQPLISEVVRLCSKKNIPVSADPKKEHFWSYRGVTLFKPNLKELVDGLQLNLKTQPSKAHLDEAFEKLQREMQIKSALITLSEYGAYFNSGKQSQIIPAHVRKIADVSGAGDTVIAVASMCLALGFELDFIAALSNLAGGLVCEESGVIPINPDTLHNEALHVLTG